MIPRLSLVVALFVAAGGLAAADDVKLVACRDSGCGTSVESVAGAAYVWLWSDGAYPRRASAAEAQDAVSKGLTPAPERAVVQVQHRGEGVQTLIAAPAAMWSDVPETLLPRFDVPKNGIVRIPHQRGAPWLVRLTGKDVGSWWTPLENGSSAIVPLPASTRRIRVADEHGSPLRSAGITLSVPRSGAARTIAAQYRADRSGVFTIETVPDREPLTLIVSEKDHAPEAITDRISQLPETIVLRRGVDVTGRFVDEDEKPITGVHVRAEAWLKGSGAIVARESTTDANGLWKLTALPRGANAVIAATLSGRAPMRKELVVEKSIDLGTLTLEAGTTLLIRVVDDADGRPIADARVSLALERAAATDEKGLARLRDVDRTASIEISATADRYLPAKLALAPPFEELTEIELTRAFMVTGRFIDANGEALPGATARVSAGNSFRDVPLDGAAFRIALQPDERTTIELSSTASRVLRLEVEGGRGETRDLGTLSPDTGPSVRGRIVTADGNGVAAASIWTPRASDAGPLTAWATGRVIRVHTDADGRFTLRGAGPEATLLRIDAPGFARGFRFVSFDPNGNDVDVGDFVLKQGVAVTVIGRPEMSDAVARLVLRPEAGDVDALVAPMRGGVATIRNVPAGKFAVAVVRERSTICRKEIDVADTRDVEVDCTAGAVRVHGTVLVGDRPADGGTLVWSSPQDVPVAGVIMNNVSRLGAVQQQAFGATSDVILNVGGDGRFVSDDLGSGRWVVRWTAPDGGTAEPREVVIAERPDVAVILRYEPTSVRGMVVDEKSQPVRRASVRQLNGTAFAVTAAHGTFAVTGLAHGMHRFQAEAGDLKSETVSVTIEPGREVAPLRLVLRHGDGDVVSVRVVANGMPAGNALVFVETSSGETRIVTAGGDGAVAVSFDEGLPASMRFAAIHDGRWTFSDWRPSSTFRDGLTLTIGDTGSLAVRTEDSGGKLDVHGPYGWNIGMLMTRIGGVPLVSEETPLQIAGLPPGDYDLRLGAYTIRAAVQRDETTAVTFRR